MSTSRAKRGSETRRLAAPVFTLTIFLSASLLFFVQPLFAKIVLPAIGGSPGVWATAMLFFQSVLLAGYLYAHFSARYLPLPLQVGLHLAIWAGALLFLPPSLPEGWQLDATRPIARQTLWLFAVGIGVPFALLSSNAPLIQSWYARSGGPSANDPYFLYGASNLGSMIALLAFPLIAEPNFGAGGIAQGFTSGFVMLGLGLAACGALLIGGIEKGHKARAAATVGPELKTMLFWGLLAFVPSSLMLAVTTKISTDIGAVPLVWVIPLALYLLSFVIAFGKGAVISGRWFTLLAQLASVAMLCLFAGVAGDHLSNLMICALILCFAILTVWAHRVLYLARPESDHLTTFYVVMSVGGALGGLFNSIIGPVLFSDPIEGPATLMIALLLVFAEKLEIDSNAARRGFYIGLPLALCTISIVMLTGPSALLLGTAIVAALGILALAEQRLNVLAVAASLIIGLSVWLAAPDDRIFADRSFFGLHQVLEQNGVRLYSNGTTIHGAQQIADFHAERPTPLTYYSPGTPMGQVMLSEIGREAKSIGIVGLGVGSLACYAQEGQDWHFYEIDSMVDQVARDPSLFTFLSTCAPSAPTHLGDARVVLAGQENLTFDILVIDAYSSDAVPVHLTTLEAMELYLDRLAPGGVLLFHISNRYYDIGRPLSRSAQALGISAWRQVGPKENANKPGLQVSDVVMIARTPADVAPLTKSANWEEIISDQGPVWTDDRADPLSIIKPGVLWR